MPSYSSRPERAGRVEARGFGYGDHAEVPGSDRGGRYRSLDERLYASHL